MLSLGRGYESLVVSSDIPPPGSLKDGQHCYHLPPFLLPEPHFSFSCPVAHADLELMMEPKMVSDFRLLLPLPP